MRQARKRDNNKTCERGESKKPTSTHNRRGRGATASRRLATTRALFPTEHAYLDWLPFSVIFPNPQLRSCSFPAIPQFFRLRLFSFAPQHRRPSFTRQRVPAVPTNFDENNDSEQHSFCKEPNKTQRIRTHLVSLFRISLFVVVPIVTVPAALSSSLRGSMPGPHSLRYVNGYQV